MDYKVNELFLYKVFIQKFAKIEYIKIAKIHSREQ